MTRYYITVILINILFAAFFYFKLTNTGLSTKAFIFIGGFSAMVGISFPLLAGFFNIYVVIGINLLIISLGTYQITQMENANPPEAKPESDHVITNLENTDTDTKNLDFEDTDTENTDPVVLVAAATEDIIIQNNLDQEETAEEAVEAIEEAIEEAVQEAVQEAIEEAVEDVEIPEEVETEPEPETETETEPEDNTGGLPGLDNTAQGEEIMISEQRGPKEVLELIYSYIDRGFNAKIGGKLDLAIKYFSSALDLNPPPDLKSMLVFDLHSMYRELGQYTEAKQCMEEFLGCMSGELPSDVAREITINIKYVEILQETLNKANTPNLPFSKLPALIKVSVEGKVNQWLNNAFNN